ncbi:MAG: hypothetical protein ABI467_07110 [Kofleriaceae bacterium]
MDELDSERVLRADLVRPAAIACYVLAMVALWLAPTDHWLQSATYNGPEWGWDVPGTGNLPNVMLFQVGALAMTVLAALGAIVGIAFGWRSGVLPIAIPAFGITTGLAAALCAAIAWSTLHDAAAAVHDPTGSGPPWSIAMSLLFVAVHTSLLVVARRRARKRERELAELARSMAAQDGDIVPG